MGEALKKIIPALLLIIVGVLAGAHGTLWYWTRLHAIPHFEGPFATLHESIWRFNHPDRAQDARLEQVGSALQIEHAPAGWAAALSDEEIKSKRKSDQFIFEVREKVSSWETHLTREDVNAITESNPRSLYRRAGWFKSIPTECTENEYQNLRAHLSLQELSDRAYLVTQYVSVAEKPFEEDYSKARLALLQNEDYWTRKSSDAASSESNPLKLSREWVTAWFEAHGDSIDQQSPDADHFISPSKTIAGDNSSTITISQASTIDPVRQLESSGIEPSQVYDTVSSYVIAAPDCLIGVHPEFIQRLKTEVTLTRGKVLLDRLAQWIGQTGTITANFADLPLDRSDSLYGSPQDGWGNDYFYDRSNGSLKVYSSANNPFSAADIRSGIFIGEIDMPSAD